VKVLTRFVRVRFPFIPRSSHILRVVRDLLFVGVRVALNEPFDGAELDVGEVCHSGNIPISLNFSRFREIFVGFGRGMGVWCIGGHRNPWALLHEKEHSLYTRVKWVKELDVFVCKKSCDLKINFELDILKRDDAFFKRVGGHLTDAAERLCLWD
jgi:hypothetical protein